MYDISLRRVVLSHFTKRYNDTINKSIIRNNL